MMYKPVTCVWEVTMGCNMRCGHCGSSCAEPLPGELTTEEAYGLIDQIAELGLQWITLSGGEPTTRKDLPLLVRRLRERGISVNVITNGWLMTAELARSLRESGVYTVAVSIDGTEEIHDSIRKEGSFARTKSAIAFLKDAGIKTGVITTVSKRNLDILAELREQLIDIGADSWQLQIGLPMGNLAQRPDWLIEPEQMNDVIDFCYQTAMQGRIVVYPADCIGYYTEKEEYIRQKSFPGGTQLWDGCNAGVRGFGVLHNGDILGCTSIRDREYIEGNIKDKSLLEIWHGPDSFQWRRAFQKTDLTGDCAICTYGGKCLGGCPNTRLTMNGTMKSENLYCAYNVALKDRKAALAERTDGENMLAEAKSKVLAGETQDAALLSGRAMELLPDEPEVPALKGFAEYMCGNYVLCEEANRRHLELSPEEPYALKGLGLALHKQGRSDEGVALIEEAAKLAGYRDQDILHDLSIVRGEMAALRR